MEDLSDDDIVISGISGRFPSSNNVNEFAYNLYNKIDMTDEDESRWKHFHADVPKRFGKIRNLEKFDASFFSTLNKHANWTDPQMRILLEHSYEAILDAGISPQSLIGSKTGVFIGCSISDSKDAFVHRYPPKDGYVVLGNAQFYLSNRISYALGLCGPSFTVDTACSSSAYALDCAFHYLQTGMCDAALVGGSQLILNCGLAAEYTKLGILAKDGVCRPFDENATGFARADTICVIFLQKLKDSKRIYANLVYSCSNNDGFKKEGASFPSKIMQQRLIEDFYKTIKFDPETINFVEAHTTGTKLGDPEEVCAIDEAFCKNNNRSGALTIGSVKSNMGHAEAASGMSSIVKILIAFENQKFPPNINLENLRSDIPAFAENRIKVATDTVDLTGNYIAMNSFGLGGANAHALFRGNTKQKINFGIPSDEINRIVLWSGRTEEAVNTIFDDIIKRPLDAEHIILLQNSQILTSSANTYRGYGIFSHNEENNKAICLKRDIQFFNGTRRPIVFVFSGIGSQWSQMGRDLMKIPLFEQSIESSHKILEKFGLNLKDILMNENRFENVLNSYVGIVGIEIGLVDILKALNIEPDFIIGHSVGELCCSYADGCFTAEETILAAYARGSSSNEVKTIKGAMAAIGMNHMKLENILPQDIDVACHNANDSTTISGPAESVREFIEEMKEKKIFAKEVACSGIPLHSRYITEFGEKLNEKLKEIIKAPKARSKKWLSSTFPEDIWNNEEVFYSSADYHTRNLLNPVFFQEVTEMLPQNAITIEIAPHGLLRSILKRSLKDGTQICLTQKDCKDGVAYFMDALGKLFQHGVDMDVSKLYPQINFPVSRGTPMISPNIKWNHEDNHYVPHFDSFNTFERRNVIINMSDKKFEFIQGHIIDGRFLFPATGWIVIVWETFAMMNGRHFEHMKVILEDIHFLRATSLNKNQDVLITISVHRGTGRFEVIEGSSAVCYGYIKQVEAIEMSVIPPLSDENTLTLKCDDFYREFRLHGFCHLGDFKGVYEIRHDGLKGKIKWINNWITFIDSMTHFEELQTNSKQLALPTNIRKIVIDPHLHFEMLDRKIQQIKNEYNEEENSTKQKEHEILYNVEICPLQRIIQSGGVELHDKINRVVNRRRQKEPNLEVYRFIPYFSSEFYSMENATKILIQTVLDDIFQPKFSSIEIDDGDGVSDQYLSENISEALKKIPLIISNVTLLSKKEDIKLEGVDTSTEEIYSFNGIDLIIKRNCIKNSEFLESSKSVLNERGFIVSIDNGNLKLENDFKVVGKIPVKHENSTEIISILRYQFENFDSFQAIEITSNIENWLEPLQKIIKECPVILYSYNEEPSGILGFINCIRREYANNKIKCVFIDDPKAPHFDINDNFYRSQLELGHAINVYKNGKWGSYRHLEIIRNKTPKPQNGHCYANCLVKGDLSTLAWLRGPLKLNKKENLKLKYASLNFKDVMIALGRIPENIFDRIEQLSPLGLEVTGVKNDGTRVMGIALNTSAISTHYNENKALLWDVPDNWTLEQAATVPLVYTTVYFAYFVTSQIRAGKKILIHSGSGGVGQAAIEIAFAYGLDVFTTVSTEEKKKFLLDKFPKLNPANIGNSRNTSFEKLVLTRTGGKGVDYVLNSLADEKLQASIRCLGKGGTLLEIGKYDIVKGTQLDMRYLAKRISFKAVVFDDLPPDSEEMRVVYNLVKNDLAKGVIKPLNSTVFNASDIEEAFRFMAAGKHIGKVLLKIRDNENDDESLPLNVLNRVYCNPNESYVIIGGLGGFGLELADWLVIRGCRKLILSSSRGFKNEYQILKVELWKTYGAKVLVSTSDVTSEEGCENLLNEAISLGPIGGIFNLAVILRDGIFENLDAKMFNESLAPKAQATKNLDNFSRRLCPTLSHFVVFSSVSCGMGNAGQSNYGFSNSVMERIIEKRCEDGLPAKAIQWGAIGDVGLLADYQIGNLNKEIGGTLPQSIFSCIDVLDDLLISNDPIVSSMIVAEKHASDSKKGNIIDMILKIMGIRDRKTISMDSTLTQLGIDSLMGVEIAQLLERDFDMVLTSQEIRSLTLTQLEKRAASKNVAKNDSNENGSEEVNWMKLLLSGVINEETLEIFSIDQIYKVNDLENDDIKVLIFPGFYGVAADIYKDFARNLKYPSYILQLYDTSECTQLDDVIEILAPSILQLFTRTKNFVLIGHSFGSVLALKIAKKLEENGKNGQLFELDGSPQYIHRLSHKFSLEGNEEQFKSGVAMITFDIIKNHIDESIVKEAYESNKNWEDKLRDLMEKSNGKFSFDIEFIQTNIINAVANRLKICQNFKEDLFLQLESTKIFLTRASKPAITGIHKDYGLAKLSNIPLKINLLEGDHVTLLNNLELTKYINENM